jgi:hypothetical protein
MLTLCERIRRGLLGGMPDRVPLHCRARMLSSGPEGDWARELGWGIMNSASCLRLRREGCDERFEEVQQDGRMLVRQIIDTPAGQLTSLAIPYHHGGRFTIEHLFKGPADYAPLLAWIQSMRYGPAYERFVEASNELGDKGYCYSALGYDPMHEIMVRMMGVETFGYEWADHQERVLELYEALCDRHREMFRVVAEGPVEFFTYGANIQPNIVGRQRFAAYYMPMYQQLGALLHGKGKRLGAHIDDKSRSLADLMAQCPWDVMEALAVIPDGDITVRDARALWPGRALSLNFPSGLQMAGAEAIREATRQFIREAGAIEGLLISLTEAQPAELEQMIFTSIALGVDDMA